MIIWLDYWIGLMENLQGPPWFVPWNRMGFPVNFPLNQSIEYSTASNAILY
jgi:hypothetical protein